MGVRNECRHFSREFKRDVVLLVFEKGVPVRKVALFVGTGNLKPEDAEFKRLHRELDKVKKEWDILKKPWASFPNGAGKIPVH